MQSQLTSGDSILITTGYSYIPLSDSILKTTFEIRFHPTLTLEISKNTYKTQEQRQSQGGFYTRQSDGDDEEDEHENDAGRRDEMLKFTLFLLKHYLQGRVTFWLRAMNRLQMFHTFVLYFSDFSSLILSSSISYFTLIFVKCL